MTFPLAYFKNTVIHIYIMLWNETDEDTVIFTYINFDNGPVSFMAIEHYKWTGPKDQVSNCPIFQLFLEKAIRLICANFNNCLFLPSHLKT